MFLREYSPYKKEISSIFPSWHEKFFWIKNVALRITFPQFPYIRHHNITSVSICDRNCAHLLTNGCLRLKYNSIRLLIISTSLYCFESCFRSVWMRVADISNFQTFVDCCAAWTSYITKYYTLKEVTKILELVLVRLRIDDQTKVSFGFLIDFTTKNPKMYLHRYKNVYQNIKIFRSQKTRLFSSI